MIEHKSPISGVAVFHNFVATAGYDNKLILWDAAQKKALACGFHDHLVNQCQFSPCGNYIATSSSDYSARLWTVPDLRLKAVFTDHTDDVEGISFHPHLPLLATSSRDKTIRIFNFDGHLAKKIMAHEKDVLSVEWINDQEIISSGDDGAIRCWNINSNEIKTVMQLEDIELDNVVYDDKGVIFGGNDKGEILILSNNRCEYLQAHLAGIKRLAYDKRKKLLVSTSYDRTVKIWRHPDTFLLECFQEIKMPPEIWARSCKFTDQDELIFSTFGTSYASYNYLEKNWNLSQVSPTHGINALLEKDGDIYAVGDSGIVYKNKCPIKKLGSLCNFIDVFANTLLAGGQLGCIFDVVNDQIIYHHHSPLNCAVEFKSSGSSFMAIGSYTGELIILKQQNGKIEFSKALAIHSGALKGVSASADSLFTVCADGSAAEITLSDLTIRQFYEKVHDKIANSCAYLGNNCFVTVGRDLHLRLFDNNQIEKIKTPHTHSIKAVCVHSDANTIVTGSYSGEIGLYNVKLKKWQVHRPTISGISNLIYSAKNQKIYASSFDGHIYSLSNVEGEINVE